jgi:hypothetical protein
VNVIAFMRSVSEEEEEEVPEGGAMLLSEIRTSVQLGAEVALSRGVVMSYPMTGLFFHEFANSFRQTSGFACVIHSVSLLNQMWLSMWSQSSRI